MKHYFFTAILIAIPIVVLAIVGSDTSARAEVNARSAAELYARNCASCHGRDGQAKTTKARRYHARNLTDSAWHDNVTDERIFNSIINGKGKMPAYDKKLSEREIDSLVSYVRALRK